MTKNHIDYLANVEQARHNRVSEQQQGWQLTINQQQADAATKNAKTNRLQYKADKKYKERTGKASLIQAKASKSQAKSSATQAKAATKQADVAAANAVTNRLAAEWNHAYQDAMARVASEGNTITKDYNDKWLNQKQDELDSLINKYTSEANLNKVRSGKELTSIFTNMSHALNEWYNSFVRKGELKVKQGKLKVDKYNAMTQNILAQYKSLNYATKSFKNAASGLSDIAGIGGIFATGYDKIMKAAGKGKSKTNVGKAIDKAKAQAKAPKSKSSKKGKK